MIKLDQFADLRAFDHRLEHVAESAAIAAAGRCGQSEDDRVRIGIDDMSDRSSRASMMGFVDDHDLGRRQFHRLCPHRSRVQGLDAATCTSACGRTSLSRPALMMPAMISNAFSLSRACVSSSSR